MILKEGQQNLSKNTLSLILHLRLKLIGSVLNGVA